MLKHADFASENFPGEDAPGPPYRGIRASIVLFYSSYQDLFHCRLPRPLRVTVNQVDL